MSTIKRLTQDPDTQFRLFVSLEGLNNNEIKITEHWDKVVDAIMAIKKLVAEPNAEYREKKAIRLFEKHVEYLNALRQQ